MVQRHWFNATTLVPWTIWGWQDLYSVRTHIWGQEEGTVWISRRSAVIDELLTNHMERDIGVAYIHLDYDDKEAQNLENVFASLLKQVTLCKEKEGIEDVRRLYRACNMGAQRPEIDALVETLGQMSRYFKQVFIVIDALDE
ncbi:hypothetical protein GGP41_000269 [Bipolaris sorokiniana]|uniref:Nephrocystin 3-like N-terminal domain-containing protein n=2 Tax=Cochliobolus sativus TaxID=45130 RepID=A0A8H5ZE33_COCSA|nr:uncharacterized protein COCSADRAFT_156250 [Bipolaris sorokiniana ND90Pr]EMD70130.1 hypothetical protein COCSADRAFT_156250 [Bipolaris sorokiniana ND90Pr]KAF5847570.1 hypothetical protein GGP41_000269 [Bipolaris sorokiniana]